jgi:hypothetical protein
VKHGTWYLGRYDCPICRKRILARPGAAVSRAQRLRDHIRGAHGIRVAH